MQYQYFFKQRSYCYSMTTDESVMPQYLVNPFFLCPTEKGLGWGPEQPDLVGGDPAHSRGMKSGGLHGPFQTKLFYDSMKQKLKSKYYFHKACLVPNICLCSGSNDHCE